MSKEEAQKASMLKCKTVEEWAARHLRVELTDKFRTAFDEAHGVAKPVPTRRKRRTKAEMEAASVETSD